MPARGRPKSDQKRQQILTAAIELFTRNGYEQNTIHGMVDDALEELAEEIKEFVEGSDTASGRPPAQGLADEEDDEGVELRRRS